MIYVEILKNSLLTNKTQITTGTFDKQSTDEEQRVMESLNEQLKYNTWPNKNSPKEQTN